MVATAPTHAMAEIAGAVGYVTPGITVEIVDQSGRALPAGQEGIVRIDSPYGPRGYLGDPAESATAFRDGWFHPGDIGHLREDGLLIIGGRETSVINLGGDKLKPELVEEVVASFPGIDQAAVLGLTDELGIEQLWSLVVSRSQWDEQALRAHCRQRLPTAFVPARFIMVESLPRNAMGKIERPRLPEIVKAEIGGKHP